MQSTDPQVSTAPAATSYVYSATARRLHWWTVVILLIQIPLGFVMSYRGNDLDIWDNLTNNMYSTHKLTGLVLLALIVGRLLYRLVKGAPADEPTLNAFEKVASHLTHWVLYLLLLAAATSGWVGISVYGARDLFGFFEIPAIAAKNGDAAPLVFQWHKYFAIGIVTIAALHIAAALMHYFVKKDGVLARMLPAVGRRS